KGRRQAALGADGWRLYQFLNSVLIPILANLIMKTTISPILSEALFNLLEPGIHLRNLLSQYLPCGALGHCVEPVFNGFQPRFDLQRIARLQSDLENCARRTHPGRWWAVCVLHYVGQRVDSVLTSSLQLRQYSVEQLRAG